MNLYCKGENCCVDKLFAIFAVGPFLQTFYSHENFRVWSQSHGLHKVKFFPKSVVSIHNARNNQLLNCHFFFYLTFCDYMKHADVLQVG